MDSWLILNSWRKTGQPKLNKLTGVLTFGPGDSNRQFQSLSVLVLISSSDSKCSWFQLLFEQRPDEVWSPVWWAVVVPTSLHIPGLRASMSCLKVSQRWRATLGLHDRDVGEVSRQQDHIPLEYKLSKICETKQLRESPMSHRCKGDFLSGTAEPYFETK